MFGWDGEGCYALEGMELSTSRLCLPPDRRKDAAARASSSAFGLLDIRWLHLRHDTLDSGDSSFVIASTVFCSRYSPGAALPIL